MIRISNVKLNVDTDEAKLKNKIGSILKTEPRNIKNFKVVKKSIDARDKNQINFVYTIDAEVKNESKYLKNKNVQKVEKLRYRTVKVNDYQGKRPVIVGSGPSGLFAALILAEAGIPPIIIERGKDVDARVKDVENFWNNGVLNTNSNVQFGEGGAGTFSDGKLTTGINDFRIKKVLEEFVLAGAPKEILYFQKPHIGTDKLVTTVKNIRTKITVLGGEFRFSNLLTGIQSKDGKIEKVEVQDLVKNETYTIDTNVCILALGHSARDTFEMLYNNGVKMEAKSFSVGVRIEHKQDFIDESQYGIYAGHPKLGAADYKLNSHLSNGRGAYTFCMCPGGKVVGASSEENAVVTNGMSYYKRDLENGNSGLLVSVTPNDFPDKENPLSGIELQQKLEREAFVLGGSNYFAPAQKVEDFLKDRKTTSFGQVMPTYYPGVTPSDLRECLPEFIVASLKEALLDMDKKIKGFASGDAVITAVETRSSSPVRIQRNASFESNIKGVYPLGEGAGYAGGIMSAAVDGIKCAEIIAENAQTHN